MPRITEVIKRDHQQIFELYKKIVDCEDDDCRIRYRNEFTWEVARHLVAEELVLFPAMQKYTHAGKDMIKDDHEEHKKVKNILKDFAGTKPSGQKYQFDIKQLMSTYREHVHQEEGEHLPVLERNLPEEESEALAAQFEKTKSQVPTRSHPKATGGHFSSLTSLLVAPVDKLGDKLRHFPEDHDTEQ